jgi:hypothetical protein
MREHYAFSFQWTEFEAETKMANGSFVMELKFRTLK